MVSDPAWKLSVPGVLCSFLPSFGERGKSNRLRTLVSVDQAVEITLNHLQAQRKRPKHCRLSLFPAQNLAQLPQHIKCTTLVKSEVNVEAAFARRHGRRDA